VPELQPYSVTAHNTDTASSNRIHDDETARRFGFRGGLVPGVDTYAYLAHPPAAAWGRAWVERGTMRARFHQPVYDGDTVTVVPTSATGLEVRDPSGGRCATAEAGLPDAEAPAPDPAAWPEAPLVAREERPPASPATLAEGTLLALGAHRFHAEVAERYLDDVREPLALYRAERIAHPAWILRDANHVLSANVVLGPWIHVESDVVHHGAVEDGDEVSARARVTREWEHKGHRFVELAVLHLADARPVAVSRHVAIYRPRQVAEAG
jgi:acyl dehydratase